MTGSPETSLMRLRASARRPPVIAVPQTADPDAKEIEFTESAMDVGEILDKYEAFTGRSTLRDGTIQGTMLPLKSNGLMTRRQAAEYIKAFLLLNGYSIVPSDIENVDKVIPTARGPQLEQGPELKSVYTDPRDLPASDQIINYILYLKNIGASPESVGDAKEWGKEIDQMAKETSEALTALGLMK